jgi:hypothetical protein
MRLLPITALLDERHYDVLRRHERELLPNAARDHARIHDEPFGHVLQRCEHDVRREERLGQRHAPVRAVVQGALEPLHGRRPERVLVQSHEVPRERADALRPHRVPLVRHRRGPDLRRLERLLDFLRGSCVSLSRIGQEGPERYVTLR